MGGAPPRPLTHSWKRCQFSIVHKGSRTVDYSPAGGAWATSFGPEFIVSWIPLAPRRLRAAPRACPTGERGGRHGRQLCNSGANSANSANFAPLGARRVRGARRISASPAGESLGMTYPAGGGLVRQLARGEFLRVVEGGEVTHRVPRRGEQVADVRRSGPPHIGNLLRQDHRSRLRPRPRRRLHRAAAGGGPGLRVVVGGGSLLWA